jgi:uridylate kinase
MTPRYKRVLYKISGEALMGNQSSGIDPAMLEKVVSDVQEAQNLGTSIALVVGGGNIFRGAALAAQGMDRVTGDHMGMLAIVMNALALRMAFDQRGIAATVLSGLTMPQVCEPFSQRAMIKAREAGDVIIFAAGTGSPFFTSDTGAALRAAEFGAQAILKGTQVDGIYDADPRKNPKAERFDTLTHDQVLEKRLGIMDAASIALARDNDIDVVVFSLHETGNLARVICGQGTFTTVITTPQP